MVTSKKGYAAIPSRKNDLQKYWEKIEEDNPQNFLEKEFESEYETITGENEENNEDDENVCDDNIYDGISSYSL